MTSTALVGIAGRSDPPRGHRGGKSYSTRYIIDYALARAISGGEPTAQWYQIVQIVGCVWLADRIAWIGQRVSSAQVCQRLDTAVRVLVGNDGADCRRAEIRV